MSMKFILISSFYVYKTWNVFFKPMEQFSLVFRPSFYLPIILSKGHLWYSDKNPHDFDITLYAKQLLVMKTACITNFIRSALNGIHYLIAVHASEISNYYITFQSLTTKSHLCKTWAVYLQTTQKLHQFEINCCFMQASALFSLEKHKRQKTCITPRNASTKQMKFPPLTSNRIALDIHYISILYWRWKQLK